MVSVVTESARRLDETMERTPPGLGIRMASFPVHPLYHGVGTPSSAATSDSRC